MSTDNKIPGQPVCGDSGCNFCERWPEATSPAMNAASPTDKPKCEGCNGYGMVGNILDQDTCPFCGGSGETTAMEGSGPDTYEMPVNCLPCSGTGAISQGSARTMADFRAERAQMIAGTIPKGQGSATSGEAAARELDLYDEIECDLPALFGRASSEGHDVGQNLARELQGKLKTARSRAALAASAEQSNPDHDGKFALGMLTQVARMGASPAGLSLAVQLFGVGPCAACGFRKLHCRCPVSAEQSNSAGSARQGGNTCEAMAPSLMRVPSGAAPVAGRAAAPASVPEGYALVPMKLTEEMHVAAVRAIIRSTGNDDFPPAVWSAMISAAPEVAQPAAQGERPTPWNIRMGVAVGDEVSPAAAFPHMKAELLEWRAQGERAAPSEDLPEHDMEGHLGTKYYSAQKMREWGASQRRAGQLDMTETITTWGENQRKYGRRAGLEEAAKLFDTSPHAEEFRVNIAESIRALKSLATPAPTAGEPSTEPDGLCNSALRAEPAGNNDAGRAVLNALRNGIPLQEPVSIGKALRAGRAARMSLSGGTGPVAAAFLVNIQLTSWANGPEIADAYTNGYNTGVKQYRGALLELADSIRKGKDSCATQGGEGAAS